MERSLKEAQRDFDSFLREIQPKSIPAFLQWIGDTYLDESSSKPKYIEDATLQLREIAAHIKLKIPLNGVFPSETINCPKDGHDSDCKEETTMNVDCFLYEDDDIDTLVSEGKLSRSYCVDCFSRNIKPLTYISHSLSIPQLEYMFTKVVPLMKKPEGFKVVDIGSRFGGICAAALLYSRGRSHVTGIEINEDLCKLQNEIMESFNLSTVNVVHSDVRKQKDVIRNADVIVMNNVFSFFLSNDEQIDCWKFLYETMKVGALLFHNPSIETTVEHLNLPFDIKKWLKKRNIRTITANFAGGDEELFEDLSTIDLYEVLDVSGMNTNE